MSPSQWPKVFLFFISIGLFLIPRPLSLNLPLVSAGLLNLPFLLKFFFVIFLTLPILPFLINRYIVEVDGTYSISLVFLLDICSGDQKEFIFSSIYSKIFSSSILNFLAVVILSSYFAWAICALYFKLLSKLRFISRDIVLTDLSKAFDIFLKLYPFYNKSYIQILSFIVRCK